ncbi:MAG: hypothetical protein ABI206_04780, partial [Antricoccus sp.]
ATYDGLIYPGAPSLSLMAGALGLPGVLLAIANAKPQEAIAAFSGDPKAQLALSVADQHGASLFPTGIKALTHAAFGTAITARLGS